MTPILSQHGNVIAADFRNKAGVEVTIRFNSETLYCDGAVILTRVAALLHERPLAVFHFLGDLSTGTIVQLNNTDSKHENQA